MDVLFVTGDDDFAANDFERSNHTVQSLAEELAFAGEPRLYEGADYHFYAALLEFGDVDPKFIEFIKDKIQDYDQSKDTNFYIVKE